MPTKNPGKTWIAELISCCHHEMLCRTQQLGDVRVVDVAFGTVPNRASIYRMVEVEIPVGYNAVRLLS